MKYEHSTNNDASYNLSSSDECDFCFGDEAIYWKDGENNAFVDSKGEMMVTAQDKSIRFKIKFCPCCGRKF